MTLMPEVRRLRLHAYLRVCSTELQLRPCTQFFKSSKYGFFRQVIPVPGSQIVLWKRIKTSKAKIRRARLGKWGGGGGKNGRECLLAFL